MPNHIANILTVKGSPKEVKKFRDCVESTLWDDYDKRDMFYLDFNKTVPDGGNDSNDMHGQIWGTKWGAYDAHDPEEIEGGVKYEFNTAWSPPREWIKTTSGIFAKLIFRDEWCDEGGGSGIIEAEGETVDDYPTEDIEWRKKHDESFKELLEEIEKGDYQELLDKYVEYGEPEYSDLEGAILARIKDKDLPLFMTFHWYNLEDKYQKRLKEA